MSFPVVAAVNGGNNADTPGTSHTVNLPASIEADDLLLVFFTATGNYPTITFPEGWIELFATSTTNFKFGCWYRVADGEEGATISVSTPDGNAYSAHTSYRINNYFGTPEAGTSATGASANPNPPNLAPTWGDQEALWFAACGHHVAGSHTITVYPTNYTDGREDIHTATDQRPGVGTARRELEAASEDPGTFTLSQSSNWVANAVAVKAILPIPDPPTDIEATDGDHTDKVVITWTKSDGATGYQVYRDGAGLGWLGDVATHDDEGADAPTITPGAAVASDGLYKTHVALSLSGTSANNGTTHTYKVRARNSDEIESGDSATDTGYVGVGALTYQWQRSFRDNDELYTSIIGATSATHDDYDAPERGWGRYYRCVLDATGAAQEISAVNRGYILATYTLQGATRIDALDFLAQLGDETVLDYSADEKAADTIIDELLALQHNTPAVTAGTIDYTTVLSITVPQDTILGVLMRLQEMLGGYIYVDNDRALHWLEDIGEDKGQQIRYRKNLKNIRRTIDYSNFANRIYVYGAGEGEERITLSNRICQSALVPGTDIAAKYLQAAEPFDFILAPSSWIVGTKYPTGANWKWGAGGRFLNITIGQGATIKEAYLKFPDSAFSGVVVNSKIHGEDADDAATFSTLADYDGRPRTTAVVNWNAIESWTGGGERISPDITSIIQEIVDRPGWASGKAMVIFWDDHDGGSTDDNYFRIREGSLPPVLYIAYESEAEDYIEDTVSQAEYGGIFTKTLINKAITDAGTLYQWASLKLLEMKDPYISYEIDMANLVAAGMDFEALQLGSIVRVIDEDLGINVSARIVKILRDLSNPMNIKVEIANKAQDVIDQLGRDFRWRNENY